MAFMPSRHAKSKAAHFLAVNLTADRRIPGRRVIHEADLHIILASFPVKSQNAFE